MENGALTASDVALLNRGDNGWGENSFMWIFALLILANGGFGGWGNNQFANAIGYENLATSNEVQRGFDNQNSMANEREILSAVNAGTAQSVAAANQVYHDVVGYVGDKYDELARDINSVNLNVQQSIAHQNDCCCQTKMLIAETGAGINAGIAQNRFDNAMNTAAINANVNAQIQGLKDYMVAQRDQEQQAKIQALELQQALSGVVRYPMATTYGVPSPCFNMGCGCGNM